MPHRPSHILDVLFHCTLQWRHNEHEGVSNHRPLECLLNRLFRHISKKPLKLRVTGLCEGNSPVTDGFPAQRASNAENVSIWWRHHELVALSGNLSAELPICWDYSGWWLATLQCNVVSLWLNPYPEWSLICCGMHNLSWLSQIMIYI